MYERIRLYITHKFKQYCSLVLNVLLILLAPLINMDQQEVPANLKTIFLIIAMLLTGVKHGLSDSQIVNGREGGMVQLSFSYPCDSTKVTLQVGSRLPFYNSVNPQSIPPRYELTNHKDDSDQYCFLNLTINPVSRYDEGIYILITYENVGMLPDHRRIGLRVDYPPGKASCQSGQEYVDGEWMTLDCEAPAGNLPGQIVCYQNGMRLPPFTSPIENEETLNQIILARLSDLAYCCSSTTREIHDRCECKDCGWDPIQKSPITNVSEPCPATLRVPTQGPILSPDIIEDGIMYSPESHFSTITSTLDCDAGRSTNMHWAHAVIAVLILIIIILSVYLCYWKKQFRKRLQYVQVNSLSFPDNVYEKLRSDFETDPMNISIGEIEASYYNCLFI